MKMWNKPVIVKLTASDLAMYIKAAARSEQCHYADFR